MKLKESKGMSLIVFTIVLAVLVVLAGGVIVYLLNNPVKEKVAIQNPTGAQSNLGSIETDDLSYLSSARSISLLKKSLNNLLSALNGIDNDYPIDMVEIDIKEAWNTLGEIIGETYEEELLDQLFSQFCLGK